MLCGVIRWYVFLISKTQKKASHQVAKAQRHKEESISQSRKGTKITSIVIPGE
jgi:hypothetical protein